MIKHSPEVTISLNKNENQGKTEAVCIWVTVNLGMKKNKKHNLEIVCGLCLELENRKLSTKGDIWKRDIILLFEFVMCAYIT